MNKDQLEAGIRRRGREFFAAMANQTPSLFNRDFWAGKLIDWCLRHEPFKVQLFRFIDVLPCLRDHAALGRHIHEYFAGQADVPAVLKWGAGAAGGQMGAAVLGGTIRHRVEEMARQFIVGATVEETLASLARLRQEGYAFTLDILGEAVVSEREADDYVAGYLTVLEGLGGAQAGWPALGDSDGPDWDWAPRVNVSIKPSALDSQARPVDFEGSVGRILERLRVVYRKVIALGGFLCIDMEARAFKDMTLEVYRRLRAEPEFRDWPHLGLAMQAYLRSAEADVEGLLAWSRRQRLPISIRLVKGAYWDYETVLAAQNGWPVPVFTVKAETDACFERCAERILLAHDTCHFACGSHNIRSASAVMELAAALGVPEDRYEFQVLYGMAEPFRAALLKLGRRVRLYCPHGQLLPGMAYLIRRLLENTSNESFLRQTFAHGADSDSLLADPGVAPPSAVGVRLGVSSSDAGTPPSTQRLGVPPEQPFVNEPPADFALPEARQAFGDALAKVRKHLGRTYPLHFDGRERKTDDLWDSVNPAQPAEVIGRVCQAGTAQVAEVIDAARRALPAWADTPPERRAEHLLAAAAAARSRLYELAAWEVLDVGKRWADAHADVAEAIDYLEYYARQMVRLGQPRLTARVPGEDNRYLYRPKGVAAVIAPWNFPLAIACGMCSAALVAGNCVVFKPSEHSPVTGWLLAELFRAAGLPPGVFHFTPGRREVIGDFLVEHPAVHLIAFTGSMAVGLRIVERAGRTGPDQPGVKKVIAEMGGKNAILIDDDADLDEAVPQVIESAFGYAGQKCSACSRVIAVGTVVEPLTARLVEAARSLRVGPAEDPANFLGPLISAAARDKALRYVELARQEGTILYQGPARDDGFYAPIALVGSIRPEHRLAQEEVFGPVLAVMAARDFDEALAWANSTRYALTGAVFSRSPHNLDRARREFRAGNLYLNRGCTGARVGRQPFGGFGLSGVGSKAGGEDYLLQFMDPVTITENTMRRGFAAPPEAG